MTHKQELNFDIPSKITRAATINAANADNRTVEISFSSEAQIDKGSYYEVLSHDLGDVDLSWASTGYAPVLLDHEAEVENLIGVIESVSIDTVERKGRAVVRIATDAKSEQAFIKIKDNVLVNISVGATVTGYTVDKESADKPIVRCTWALQEISFCALPVDKAVGVFRAEMNSDLDKTKSETESTVIDSVVKTESVPQLEIERKAVSEINIEVQAVNPITKQNQLQNKKEGSKMELNQTEIQRAERSRVNEIYSIASELNATKDIVQRAVESGQDAGAFALEVMRANAAKPVQTAAGLSTQETKDYSIVRAVNALVTGDYSGAGLELEVSRSLSKAQGRNNTNALILPDEIIARAAGAAATTFADNQATGLKTRGPWLESLRQKTIAGRLGVTMLNGLVGGVELPRFTSFPQAAEVSEGQDGTISKVSTELKTLFPRSMFAFVELTRTHLANLPSFEAYIYAELLRSITEQIDQKVFAAVLADTDIDWKVTPTAGVNYAEIRALVTKLNNANVNTDFTKFAMNGNVEGYLASTLKSDNTSAIYLKGDDNRVAGLPSEFSSTVGGDHLILGDWSKVFVGSWNGIALERDTSQRFLSGGVILRAATDFDVGVAVPEAFTGYKNIVV